MMNREHLTRLLETATPEQLRQIARLVLRLSGYAATRITDGPYDGGADLRVHGADGSLLPLAIAISVEKDWKNKLSDDAAKAKRKLSLTRLLFISNRRIPEGSFRPLQLKLQDDLGVQVDRIDQQGIADIAMDGNKLSELLQLLDISVADGHQPSGMLGLTEAIERRTAGDFVGARRQIEQFLRRQLTHYGITIVETPAKGPQIIQADKDWSRARHELKIEHREERLERYDKQVLAWLASIAEDDPAHAPLVVTWDRLLRRARPEGAPGGALDPLAVCELLAFIGGEQMSAETPRFAGLWLTEIEVEKGARILDTLVQLERESLADAELVQMAEAFRSQYLAERGDVADIANLERAWRGFRERRGRAPTCNATPQHHSLVLQSQP